MYVNPCGIYAYIYILYIYIYASINISWCSIVSMAKLQNFCTLPQKRNGRACSFKGLCNHIVLDQLYEITEQQPCHSGIISPTFTHISVTSRREVMIKFIQIETYQAIKRGNKKIIAMLGVPKIWVPPESPIYRSPFYQIWFLNQPSINIL